LKKFEITGLEDTIGEEVNQTITDLIDQWIKLPFDEIASGAQEEIQKNFSLDIQPETSIQQPIRERITKAKEILQEYPNLFIISELSLYKGTFEQFKGKSAFQIDIDREVLKQFLEDLEKQKAEFTENFIPEYEGFTQPTPAEYNNGEEEKTPEKGYDLPPFFAHVVILDNKNIAITFEAESTEDYSETTTKISGRYGSQGLFLQVDSSESTGHFLDLQIIKDKAETTKERFTISLAVQGLGSFTGDSTIANNES
jgi:hypothetical protein